MSCYNMEKGGGKLNLNCRKSQLMVAINRYFMVGNPEQNLLYGYVFLNLKISQVMRIVLRIDKGSRGMICTLSLMSWIYVL